MRFKNWIINEMQHRELPSPIKIGGVMVDAIDFRVEDWKKGLMPLDEA